jgi:hypothetical protein
MSCEYPSLVLVIRQATRWEAEDVPHAQPPLATLGPSGSNLTLGARA